LKPAVLHGSQEGMEEDQLDGGGLCPSTGTTPMGGSRSEDESEGSVGQSCCQYTISDLDISDTKGANMYNVDLCIQPRL